MYRPCLPLPSQNRIDQAQECLGKLVAASTCSSTLIKDSAQTDSHASKSSVQPTNPPTEKILIH